MSDDIYYLLLQYANSTAFSKKYGNLKTKAKTHQIYHKK